MQRNEHYDRLNELRCLMNEEYRLHGINEKCRALNEEFSRICKVYFVDATEYHAYIEDRFYESLPDSPTLEELEDAQLAFSPFHVIDLRKNSSSKKAAGL